MWRALLVGLLALAACQPERAETSGVADRAVASPSRDSARAEGYLPDYQRNPNHSIRPGTELVLAYIGGSTCAPCHSPEFKDALEEAKVLMHERAEAEGKDFVAIGVAVDHDVEAGLRFLNASGRFDEVAAGQNWFNTAVLSHPLREDGSERVTSLPMVLVFERDMSMDGGGAIVGGPRYRAELVGSLDLPEWVAAGAPLK